MGTHPYSMRLSEKAFMGSRIAQEEGKRLVSEAQAKAAVGHGLPHGILRSPTSCGGVTVGLLTAFCKAQFDAVHFASL